MYNVLSKELGDRMMASELFGLYQCADVTNSMLLKETLEKAPYRPFMFIWSITTEYSKVNAGVEVDEFMDYFFQIDKPKLRSSGFTDAEITLIQEEHIEGIGKALDEIQSIKRLNKLKGLK